MNRRIPSTFTPLLENWRRRIRGNERRFPVPLSYVVSEAAPIDEIDEVGEVAEVDDTEVELLSVHRSERTGESHDWDDPRERQGEDDPSVLRFPGDLPAVLPSDSTAPARPSGPLSWAYWAARHR